MALSTNLELPKFRYTVTATDANGNTYLAPAVGYKLYVYEAGTSTQLTVYQDAALTTPHSQPITLDADGSATVYFDQEAKVELQDTDSATVSGFPVDGIQPISASSAATINEWQPSGVIGTYVSGSTFTVPGDQTATFLVGRRVRINEGGAYRYGEITVSTYTTSTSVTVVLDSGSISASMDGNEVYLHINSSFITHDTTQTLTNKTLTSPVINTGVSGSAFLDDDTMATATSSTIASAESVKAYVDARQSLDSVTATTSGATHDYTGIASTVKKFTFMFDGVSTDTASAAMYIYLGDSGGFESSGYLSMLGQISGTSAQYLRYTTYVGCTGTLAAASVVSGSVTFTLLDASSNTWVWQGCLHGSDGSTEYKTWYLSGSKSLSSTLTQVRLDASAAAAFDAGKINILYEG